MQSINQSYAHLLEKAASNDIGQDVMNKIENLVVELNTRNYHAASAIQTVRYIHIYMSGDVH